MALTKIKESGISDNAVTAGKIAAGAVVADITSGSVTATHLAGSIPLSKTNFTAGNGISLATDTVSVSSTLGHVTGVGTLSSLATSGNVGVGSGTTSSPSSASRTLRIQHATGGASLVLCGDNDNETAWDILANTSGQLDMRKNNSSKLLIETDGSATFAGELRVNGGQASIYGAEGGDAILELNSDEADDNADRWQVYVDSSDSNKFKFRKYSTGSWVDTFSTDTSGNATFAGAINSTITGGHVQIDNGVGITVSETMAGKGHVWQGSTYNVLSAGAVSIGSDSSNSTHMWWNTYDTGSKYNVSTGYGMDMYHSKTGGEFVIRMGSVNTGTAGDSQTLTEALKIERDGKATFAGNAEFSGYVFAGVLDNNSACETVTTLDAGSIANRTFDAIQLDGNTMYEITYASQHYDSGNAGSGGWRYVRWHAYDGSGGGSEAGGDNWFITVVENTGTGESGHTPSWSVVSANARITYGSGYMTNRRLIIRALAGTTQAL